MSVSFAFFFITHISQNLAIRFSRNFYGKWLLAARWPTVNFIALHVKRPAEARAIFFLYCIIQKLYSKY